MNQFENNILQKIYRTYTLDEGVAFLKSIITPLQTKIGMLKSELEESIAKNKPINILNNELQRVNKELRMQNTLLLSQNNLLVLQTKK
jgi:regulator of replication initiation timing